MTEEQKKERAAKWKAQKAARDAEWEAECVKFPAGELSGLFTNPGIRINAGIKHRVRVTFSREFLKKALDSNSEGYPTFEVEFNDLPELAGFIHALIVRYNFQVAQANQHVAGLQIEPLQTIQEPAGWPN